MKILYYQPGDQALHSLFVVWLICGLIILIFAMYEVWEGMLKGAIILSMIAAAVISISVCGLLLGDYSEFVIAQIDSSVSYSEIAADYKYLGHQGRIFKLLPIYK